MHPDQLDERFHKILQIRQSKVNSGSHSLRILEVQLIECQTYKSLKDYLAQPPRFIKRKLRLEEIK